MILIEITDSAVYNEVKPNDNEDLRYPNGAQRSLGFPYAE